MKSIEYYLMRHAAYYDFENQYVSYYGMITLKHSMERLATELKEKFPQKNLRIIHSVLPRAKHTSLLMEEMIKGIKVFHRSDPRLNSDKLQINDDYISDMVRECEKDGEVCLILSHAPDIEHFCKKKLETSEYIRRTIDLIEKTVLPDDEKDDLPF